MNRACLIKNRNLHVQNQHASSIRPIKNNYVRMKNVNVIFAGVLFFFLSIGANSQPKTGVAYFPGKWHLIAESAPGGGSDMNVILEQNEGKLTGTIRIGEEDAVKFSKIEEKETSVKLYFTSTHGNDVTLSMEKKDEDHVGGAIDTSVMGSFPLKGERIKESK
jgi:hypothetical protein